MLALFDGIVGKAYQEKFDPFGDIRLNGYGGRMNTKYGTTVSFD